MTPAIFQKLLAALDMNPSGAATFLGTNQRTIRRYLAGEQPIPPPIAMLFGMMAARKIGPRAARAYGALPQIIGDLNRAPGRPPADPRQDGRQAPSAGRRSANRQSEGRRPNRR